MSREKLIAALREKLDTGFQTYMADMVSRGAQIVFENAESIYYRQQAYDELHSANYLDDEMLEKLLQFKDPMQAAGDQWEFWSQAIMSGDVDMASEMTGALQGFFSDESYQSNYELEDQPIEPEQGQQM